MKTNWVALFQLLIAVKVFTFTLYCTYCNVIAKHFCKVRRYEHNFNYCSALTFYSYGIKNNWQTCICEVHSSRCEVIRFCQCYIVRHCMEDLCIENYVWMIFLNNGNVWHFLFGVLLTLSNKLFQLAAPSPCSTSSAIMTWPSLSKPRTGMAS